MVGKKEKKKKKAKENFWLTKQRKDDIDQFGKHVKASHMEVSKIQFIFLLVALFASSLMGTNFLIVSNFQAPLAGWLSILCTIQYDIPFVYI